MDLWHCNTLETFAVQGSHSAILCYIAGTALPAEFTPGEAEEQDLCIHQTGNMDLQQDLISCYSENPRPFSV